MSELAPEESRHAIPQGPAAIDLTVLILCLNEQNSIARCVEEARRFLLRNAIHGEVLVLDNGSTDASAEVARRAGARVVTETRRGYGRATIAGIHAAYGRLVILGDGDGEHDLDNLDAFWQKLQQGYDLVVGNRLAGAPLGATRLLRRRMGARLLSAVGRLLFTSPVEDMHCGLRGFDRQQVLDLGLRTPGMESASEMIAKAVRKDLRIAEVPVAQRSALDEQRTPHLRIWSDGWRHLRLMLLLSPRWLFLLPGCLLVAAGTVAMIVPLLRADWLGTYSMLFGSGMVVCGLQLVWFALFHEILRRQSGEADRTTWLVRHVSPSRLLAAGLGLGLLGLLGSAWSLVLWAEAGGDETLADSRIRVAIPSVMLLVLAVQFVFSGFLLMFLSFRRGD